MLGSKSTSSLHCHSMFMLQLRVSVQISKPPHHVLMPQSKHPLTSTPSTMLNPSIYYALSLLWHHLVHHLDSFGSVLLKLGPKPLKLMSLMILQSHRLPRLTPQYRLWNLLH